MQITKVQSTPEGVIKALQAVQGSAFELEDTAELIKLREVQPQLLTALLTGVQQDNYNLTDTYVYDQDKTGLALPTGKAYSAFGGTVKDDKPAQFRWGIPSFGIRGVVAPKDYANRRKAGSNELQDEAYVLNRINAKLGAAWDLFNEVQLINLITTGKNDVMGGSFTEYDFSYEITGTSVATNNINFTSGDPAELLRAQKKIVQQELLRAGDMAQEIIVLCGSDFFAKRLEVERNTSLARELRSTYDFASEEVAGVVMPKDGFKVDNFVGSVDGIRYVDFSASIGSYEIGADDAYMLPVQASNFIHRSFAPAQTRTYVNTEAQQKYGWSNVDERSGVTVWEESNVLTAMVNPLLLRKLKAV